jgi:hypothetical protein
VENRIREEAVKAQALYGSLKDYALGLCCTHFGYVSSLWRRVFEPAALLNPNETILEGIAFPPGEGGITVKFLSKIPLPESKINAMKPLFAAVPPVAKALEEYLYTPGLYSVR